MGEGGRTIALIVHVDEATHVFDACADCDRFQKSLADLVYSRFGSLSNCRDHRPCSNW